jgi:predicted ArsR family transcriptional regulator
MTRTPSTTNRSPTNAREAIQHWLRRDPDMDVDALADRVGKSVRQVRRYLASP